MTVTVPSAARAVMNAIPLSAELRARRERGERVFAFQGDVGLDVRGAAETAEITLYDEIGFFGVTAKAFKAALDEVAPRPLVLKINSPGGDVFDGIAMHNDLDAYPGRVEVQVTGLAASAASIVAMAADRLRMADNAFLMIHNAWALAVGDKQAMAKMVEVLGEIDQALAQTYAARAGAKAADMAALMDAETWLGAAAAIDQGLADDELPSGDGGPAALFDLSPYARVPAALKRRQEQGLRARGFSQREAAAATAEGFAKLPNGRGDRARQPSGPVPRDEAAGFAALMRSLDDRRRILTPT